MSELVQQFYGMTLRFERRFEDAATHARQVLKTSPNSPSAWNSLAESSYQLGQYEESLAAQKSAIGARGNPVVLDALTKGMEGGDYRGTVRRLADTRARLGQSWVAAQDYLRAGEPDLALDQLDQAYEQRNQNLPYIGIAPVFDPVRGHPRFQALVMRLKLPQ